MKKLSILLCLIYLTSIKSTIKSNSKANDNDNKNPNIIGKVKKTYDGKNNPKMDINKGLKNDTIKELLNRKSMMSYINRLPSRRKSAKYEGESSASSSSSLELTSWKEAWKEHWFAKKIEAINTSVPKGDTVNMVAARPWGVACGDPNQHDAPWGTCMLPMECEPEYRIYRGDYFCGRTMFICCALQLTNYDLYGGFDLSFADSSLATDTEEKKNRDRGSKERKRRRRIRERRRRRRERQKRKRKIRRAIKKIIRELAKILNRSFRNGTRARKRKTRQLKRFIKEMKAKYKKDRRAVKDIHELEMIKIDAALQKRLDEIKHMNNQFAYNDTFRELVVNGSINRGKLRELVKAYPELEGMINTRRAGTDNKRPDYLDYDIEYGYLYYD